MLENALIPNTFDKVTLKKLNYRIHQSKIVFPLYRIIIIAL